MIAPVLVISCIGPLIAGLVCFTHGVAYYHRRAEIAGAYLLRFTALLFIVAIWLGVFGL